MQVRSALRGHAPTDQVKWLREGVDAMVEAVELGFAWNEWCSWQSAEDSGCLAGKPAAIGTQMFEKTRCNVACTLEGQRTHCSSPSPTSYT